MTFHLSILIPLNDCKNSFSTYLCTHSYSYISILKCLVLEIFNWYDSFLKKNITSGWDCHGLPIELKASSKTKSRDKDALTIRSSSRNFALEALEKQKREFLSWGIMGDWTNPYLTMDKEFVKSQLRLFFDLMKKGFIYQRFMPVYWSPSSRTALAESELEYNPNVST